MAEKSVSSSQTSESDEDETTQSNTTFAESSIIPNELCTIEKIAACSRIVSSGNICRSDTIEKEYQDNIAGEKDEDEVFYAGLKSKIQKDLELKLTTDKAASKKSFRTGLNSQRKRKYPFDDYTFNLMEKFKEDQTYKNFITLQQNQALTPIIPSSTANHSNIIVNIDKTEAAERTVQVENKIETITTNEKKGNNKRNTNIDTPNNFNINMGIGNPSSTFILKLTSTVSKNIRSSAMKKATILQAETKVMYCEFGPFTPPNQYNDEKIGL